MFAPRASSPAVPDSSSSSPQRVAFGLMIDPRLCEAQLGFLNVNPRRSQLCKHTLNMLLQLVIIILHSASYKSPFLFFI